jgi:hypothetical protein
VDGNVKVICRYNDLAKAKATRRYTRSGSGNNTRTYLLTIGKEYTVYAKSVIGRRVYYLVLDDANPATDELLKHYGKPNPTFYDANLFSPPDVPVQSDWKTMKGTVFTRRRGETTSFPEFVSHGTSFYADLLEGTPETVNVFARYMKRYER